MTDSKIIILEICIFPNEFILSKKRWGGWVGRLANNNSMLFRKSDIPISE